MTSCKVVPLRAAPGAPVTLARGELRAAPWLALAAAIPAAIGVVSLAGPGVLELRVAAVAICAGAAFILDDPAHEGLACAPTPLPLRRLLRVVLMLPLLGAGWALLLWQAGTGFDLALTLELAAMLAATLAAAVVAAGRAPDGRGGAAAAPALLVSLGAALVVLPDRWTLFAFSPDDPLWEASHERWGAVLILAVLVFALANRDPASRRVARRVTRSRAAVAPVNPLPEGETP